MGSTEITMEWRVRIFPLVVEGEGAAPRKKRLHRQNHRS
jgi:hypothetical protein